MNLSNIENYLCYNKYTESDRNSLLEYLNKSIGRISWFKIIETKNCFYLYSENKKLFSKFHRKLNVIRNYDTVNYISFGNKKNKIKKIRISTTKKLYVYQITVKVKSASIYDLVETKKFYLPEIEDKVSNFVKDNPSLNIIWLNKLYKLLENMTTKTDIINNLKRTTYYKSGFYMFEYYEHNGFLLMGYDFHNFMLTRICSKYEECLKLFLNKLFGFEINDVSF